MTGPHTTRALDTDKARLNCRRKFQQGLESNDTIVLFFIAALDCARTFLLAFAKFQLYTYFTVSTKVYTVSAVRNRPNVHVRAMTLHRRLSHVHVFHQRIELTQSVVEESRSCPRICHVLHVVKTMYQSESLVNLSNV